jgi:3-oxoacyl-[acyl-carrier-protein] synthase II
MPHGNLSVHTIPVVSRRAGVPLSNDSSIGRSKRPRVVITGIGVVSPNGIGLSAFAQACLRGVSGVSSLLDAGIETAGLRSSAVARVRDWDPATVLPSAELKRVPRMVPMALQASREALEQAGIQPAPDDIDAQRRIGVCLGTGGGGLAFVEEQYRTWFTQGKGSLYSITAGTHGNLSSELSIALNLRGPSHVLSTGCTSSTDAIGHAMLLIRAGVVPAMLAGGADSPISQGILKAFELMRVVSTRQWEDPARASRPFSLDRDGFILGEGAWMFVLEDRDHALARGAAPLAELAGYGSTCDAYHRVQIAPDVVEPARAIELALADASVAGDEVGYVNLHGTGTDLNDRMETAAVKRCFGPRAAEVPMSSTKSMIGHPQGACGAAGLAATVLGMQQGIFHPTINLEEPDPQCDLDYIPREARAADVNVALCNCIAFGSKNSALVVRRCALGCDSGSPISARCNSHAPPCSGIIDRVITYEQLLDSDAGQALIEGSMHFEERSKVHEALREIVSHLDRLAIPYAVAGGMALFLHEFRRFTEDVDILVTADGLKKIHDNLDGLGYVPPFAGSKHLRDAVRGVRIEFLVAGQFPGDGKPKPVMFPDPQAAAVNIAGIHVLGLPKLVELKLASGMTNPGRVKDLGDVQQLIKVLKLPADFADKVNPYVRNKFTELWNGVQADTSDF